MAKNITPRRKIPPEPYVKLKKEDVTSLHSASGLQFCGGSSPFTYGEYLRREKLRRAGLLRFYARRSVKWKRCFYTITVKGHAALDEATTQARYFGPQRTK